MNSDDSTSTNTKTQDSTTTTGSSTSATSSKLTLKDSELFNFDPATVLEVDFVEILRRMKKIVERNRKARSLLAVEEARALEEEAKKPKRKKKPIAERIL